MFYRLVVKALIFSLFSIYFFSCYGSQYIPESNSGTSEDSLATIYISGENFSGQSLKDESYVYSIDNDSVKGREIFIKPGNYKFRFKRIFCPGGEYYLGVNYENLETTIEISDYFQNYYFMEKSPFQNKFITKSIIGETLYPEKTYEMTEKWLEFKLTGNYPEKIYEISFKKGKTYGFKDNSFTNFNFSKYKFINYARGGGVGLCAGILAGLTFGLINGDKAAEEQNQRTGSYEGTDYKYGLYFGVYPAIGTLLGVLIGYFIPIATYF